MRERFLRGAIALFFGVILSSATSLAFEYGQCLLDRSESFNASLKEYKNVALAKAAIKKMALEKKRIQIKWNYDAASLVYDLIVLRPVLEDFKAIFEMVRQSNPDSMKKIEDYLKGTSGHLALAEVDGPYRPEYAQEASDDQVNMQSLMEFLAAQLPGKKEYSEKINSLKVAVDTERIKDALGDFYDRIQESSIGTTPLDPASIGQWIELETVFRTKIIPEKCPSCADLSKAYGKLLAKWSGQSHLPTEAEFESEILPKLPPLTQIRYPRLSEGLSEARQLVSYFYVRTIEDFLFSRRGLTLALVKQWMNLDPNHKIILRQADLDPLSKDESNNESKLHKYLLTKERVLSNAFDHFVWRGQAGTDLEKSIDGVARTIYGEAESCQIAGAHQFEAIGAVIAARSISVDLENQKKNIFSTIIDYAIMTLNQLSPIEIAPLSSYERGASDFGRLRESHANSEIIGMTTPAQVVSRPVQFSVWKIGKEQEFEVRRWIPWPKELGYPEDLKISVSSPVNSDLDPAQRKVLCPNNPIFNKALEVATQVVNDYYEYANTFRFYQGSKRVVPYFYTHGPNTNLGFVKRLQPSPSLLKVSRSKSEPKDLKFDHMPLLLGDSNCKAFKLYTPKFFGVNEHKSRKR